MLKKKDFDPAAFFVSEAGAHILDIGGESTRPGVGKKSSQHLQAQLLSSASHLFPVC